MFYAGENRSERISTKRRMSQKTYSSRFRKRETPRFCKTQKKSPTVTRSWHSLLENYAQSAWQPASDICNLCSRNLGCDSSRSTRSNRGHFPQALSSPIHLAPSTFLKYAWRPI